MPSLSNPELKAHTTASQGERGALSMPMFPALPALKLRVPRAIKDYTQRLRLIGCCNVLISKRRLKSASSITSARWVCELSASCVRQSRLRPSIHASWKTRTARLLHSTSCRLMSPLPLLQWRWRTSPSVARRARATSTSSGTRTRRSTSSVNSRSCGTPRGRQ
jgi:hypothetical protein